MCLERSFLDPMQARTLLPSMVSVHECYYMSCKYLFKKKMMNLFDFLFENRSETRNGVCH